MEDAAGSLCVFLCADIVAKTHRLPQKGSKEQIKFMMNYTKFTRVSLKNEIQCQGDVEKNMWSKGLVFANTISKKTTISYLIYSSFWTVWETKCVSELLWIYKGIVV